MPTKDALVPVVVTWIDAHADGPSWMDTTDIDTQPYVVRTVGWQLQGAKPKHITVVQSCGRDGAIDHVLHIPDAMVIRIDRLKFKPTKHLKEDQ